MPSLDPRPQRDDAAAEISEIVAPHAAEASQGTGISRQPASVAWTRRLLFIRVGLRVSDQLTGINTAILPAQDPGGRRSAPPTHHPERHYGKPSRASAQ